MRRPSVFSTQIMVKRYQMGVKALGVQRDNQRTCKLKYEPQTGRGLRNTALKMQTLVAN